MSKPQQPSRPAEPKPAEAPAPPPAADDRRYMVAFNGRNHYAPFMRVGRLTTTEENRRVVVYELGDGSPPGVDVEVNGKFLAPWQETPEAAIALQRAVIDQAAAAQHQELDKLLAAAKAAQAAKP